MHPASKQYGQTAGIPAAATVNICSSVVAVTSAATDTAASLAVR
jgi:hypothetical protein